MNTLSGQIHRFARHICCGFILAGWLTVPVTVTAATTAKNKAQIVGKTATKTMVSNTTKAKATAKSVAKSSAPAANPSAKSAPKTKSSKPTSKISPTTSTAKTQTKSSVKTPSKTTPKTTNKATAKATTKVKPPKKTEVKDEEQTKTGELYVYIDDEGVPHYALEKLDSRYILFANAGPTMTKELKLAVGSPDKKIFKPYGGDFTAGLYGTSMMTGYYGSKVSGRTSRQLLNSANLARFEPLIHKHAKAHGVDVNLVKAVMAAESGFNFTAVSSKNAMGLMQVIPATGARYGVSAAQLMQPERNIYAGVRYLKDLSRMFRGQPELIVAAYNAGEGAVYKYNKRIPPYAETQNYVRKVLQYYSVYASQTGNIVYEKVQRGKKRQTVKVGGAASNLNSRRKMQKL